LSANPETVLDKYWGSVNKKAVDNKAVKLPKINLKKKKKKIAPVVVAIMGYKTECVKGRETFGLKKFAILYK
jgi:hypothetical protein